MSKTPYNIMFQTDYAQLEQLKAWMITENEQRTSFVHDISIITKHSNENTLATISLGDETVGFVTWDIFKRSGHIVVAAIAPKHRRSGIGRYLIEALFTHLLKQGILALYLECPSAVSEMFWRKMGFQKMPAIDGYSNNNTPRLYKSLLAVQESSVFNTNHIQLYKWGSTERQWWPLNYKPGTNELIKPIITPASGDWCIDYVKSELSERAVKVKNFRSGNYFDDPFLIITEL